MQQTQKKKKKKKTPNYQSKQDAYPIQKKKKSEMLIHKSIGLNNLQKR